MKHEKNAIASLVCGLGWVTMHPPSTPLSLVTTNGDWGGGNTEMLNLTAFLAIRETEKYWK